MTGKSNDKKKKRFNDDFFANPFSMEHIFRSMLEEMDREMNRLINMSFSMADEENIKKLAKDPNTIVYGYSVRIGPDGKPIVQEFGNVKPEAIKKEGLPIKDEREPLVDVLEDDKNVTIVVELPGVDKKEIKLTGNGRVLKIKVDGKKRKYYKELKLPDNVKFDKAQATYNNGVLEITMPKTKSKCTKEKKIEVK